MSQLVSQAEALAISRNALPAGDHGEPLAVHFGQERTGVETRLGHEDTDPDAAIFEQLGQVLDGVPAELPGVPEIQGRPLDLGQGGDIPWKTCRELELNFGETADLFSLQIAVQPVQNARLQRLLILLRQRAALAVLRADLDHPPGPHEKLYRDFQGPREPQQRARSGNVEPPLVLGDCLGAERGQLSQVPKAESAHFARLLDSRSDIHAVYRLGYFHQFRQPVSEACYSNPRDFALVYRLPKEVPMRTPFRCVV